MADVAENLNALAKEVFGEDGVPDLIPNMTKLQQVIKFSRKEVLGKKFAQTVRLSYPTGFTHAKGDGTAGTFSFQDVVGGSQARAEMNGYQTMLRDHLSIEDAVTCTGSKQAFKEGTKYFFEGLQSSMRKRIESMLFYGGVGMGVADSSSNVSTTATNVLMTAASYAAGIWAGMEGVKVQFYSGSTLISSGADSVFSLVSNNPLTRVLKFSGTATGITALDTALASGDLDIYFVGAKGNEMQGLHSILSNTGSQFGIDGAVYSLWLATQYAPAVAGSLTFQKVKKAIALGVGKGLDDDCELFLNPSTWDDVSSDIAELRRTDKGETSKVELGTEEIVFRSQNGRTILRPTPFVKGGFGYGLCKPSDTWKRVGAQDVTFKLPGVNHDLFIPLQSAAGSESRVYTHQAIICLAPGKQFMVSNIVNKTY